jgi:thiol-disulfide isomerase/thioredoxin
MRAAPIAAAAAAVLFLGTAPAAPAPNLTEVQTLGDVLDAFDDGSRVRVVNVWATWCAPCVAEIPDLQAIANDYRSSGVEVVGVSLDDALPGDRAASKTKVLRFLDGKGIGFRNVYYIGPPSELADELRFDGTIPITIVYDAHGRELARNEGKLDVKWFRRMLTSLAKQKPQGGSK